MIANHGIGVCCESLTLANDGYPLASGTMNTLLAVPFSVIQPKGFGAKGVRRENIDNNFPTYVGEVLARRAFPARACFCPLSPNNLEYLLAVS